MKTSSNQTEKQKKKKKKRCHPKTNLRLMGEQVKKKSISTLGLVQQNNVNTIEYFILNCA